MEQRSPEWHQERLGKVTASRIGDLMAKTKTGYSTSRANYMAELVCERLTGNPTEGFSSAAMQWGTDNEAGAKAAYAFLTDAEVADVGFVPHPGIADCGASPDGLVGADGLIEVKCPNTATHIETLLTGGIDRKYLLQMQFQMACTGRQWCDFASFDPRMPDAMQLWTKRIPRDDTLIAEIEAEIGSFLLELASKIEALRTRYELSEAA